MKKIFLQLFKITKSEFFKIFILFVLFFGVLFLSFYLFDNTTLNYFLMSYLCVMFVNLVFICFDNCVEILTLTDAFVTCDKKLYNNLIKLLNKYNISYDLKKYVIDNIYYYEIFNISFKSLKITYVSFKNYYNLLDVLDCCFRFSFG